MAAIIMGGMAQEKTVGAIPRSCGEVSVATAQIFGDELLDGLQP